MNDEDKEIRLRLLKLQHAGVHAQKRKLTNELRELHERGKFTDRRAIARRAKIKERLGDLDERSERLEAKFRDARQA